MPRPLDEDANPSSASLDNIHEGAIARTAGQLINPPRSIPKLAHQRSSPRTTTSSSARLTTQYSHYNLTSPY